MRLPCDPGDDRGNPDAQSPTNVVVWWISCWRSMRDVFRLLWGSQATTHVNLCERIATWSDEGISGFLVASPAYNKPQQAGLVKHFEAVADAAPRPVMLYNVPPENGVEHDGGNDPDLGQPSQHPRASRRRVATSLKLPAFWLTDRSNLAFGQETMRWRCPPLPWAPTESFLWLATCCQSECP